MRRLPPPICFALGLLAVLTIAGRASVAAELSPWRDGDVPSFALDRLDGGQFRLDDFSGKTVIVHFFATWCEPCRDELQRLDRLIAENLDPSITFIGIDVAEPDDRVRRFLARTPVAFPVALDRTGLTAKGWGIDALPTTIVLDRTMRPCLRALGDFHWDRAATLAALDDNCH